MRIFSTILLIMTILTDISLQRPADKAIFKPTRILRLNAKKQKAEIKEMVDSDEGVYAQDLKSLYQLIEMEMIRALERAKRGIEKREKREEKLAKVEAKKKAKNGIKNDDKNLEGKSGVKNKLKKEKKSAETVYTEALKKFRKRKIFQKLCKKLERETKSAENDELPFKGLFYAIQMDQLLNCGGISNRVWEDTVPMGPFSQHDMGHLMSNLMEFYYFFYLQVWVYPEDRDTQG